MTTAQKSCQSLLSQSSFKQTAGLNLYQPTIATNKRIESENIQTAHTFCQLVLLWQTGIVWDCVLAYFSQVSYSFKTIYCQTANKKTVADFRGVYSIDPWGV